MKFNLKNRPNVHIGKGEHILSREWYIETCIDWENWFEGFEKELRERAHSRNYVEIELIKEILGE